MDQVRVVLKLLWRERFWVLSVVAILVAVVCWQFSTSALDSEFNSRKGQIAGHVKNMRDLTQQNPHPNEQVIEGNQEQAVEQSKNVLEVWEDLYERQREEVLYWPKESLKPQFISVVETLKFRDPFPVQQAEDMRTHYWNYIDSRFDALLKIVKALKSDSRGGSRFSRGGRGGGPEGEEGAYEAERSFVAVDDGEPVDEDYLVEWHDQGNLRDKLQFRSKPTDLQIWVTQEDLWVYETLLNVIAQTNKERGATRPDNTAVRVISNLEVGRDAAAASRETASLLMPKSVGAGALESETGAYSEGERIPSMSRMEGEGVGEGVDDSAVLAYRYLDPEGNPYAGEPEDKEYRRLPVRMRLVMDQRYLPQLLVNCANAALPVEVKQVRVNPEASGAGFGGGSRYSPSRSRTRSMANIDDDPNLADVEIRGLVYIYNQPDETIFESLGAGEDQLADASVGG